jgi:hypothetical protein
MTQLPPSLNQSIPSAPIQTPKTSLPLITVSLLALTFAITSIYLGYQNSELKRQLKTQTVTPGQNNSQVICGGITGKLCPKGSICIEDADYPDATGVCVPAPETPPSCQPCPSLHPPSDNFCLGGLIESGGTNDCGCSLPPKCIKLQCPGGGWVDCMPILSEEGKIRCSQEAFGWYEANCPNFQGGAY